MREQRRHDPLAPSECPSAETVQKPDWLAFVNRENDADTMTIVRQASVEDLGELHALINLAYRRESSLLTGPRILKGELGDELADGANLFLVAERQGEVAGTIRVRLEEGPAGDPPSPYFGLFAVASQVQGLGIGRRLVAAAEEVARSLGFGAVHLDCARELGMCGYYEALGYRVVAESTSHHLFSLRPFTLVTMRKWLRADPMPKSVGLA